MIVKGSKVRVKENYSGNLSDVIGQVGTVLDVDIPADPAVQRTYLIDVRGMYRQESSYSPGRFYEYYSNVIAFSDEIEEYSYGMKDAKGTLLEIGDHVVYSGNQPGIIEGEVVDFKDTEQKHWGSQTRQVVKVKLKIARNHTYTDGAGRSFTTEGTYTQWFEHGSRMLIIEKNLSHLQLFNGMRDLRVLDC